MSYIKRVESKIALIHVLIAIEETSQAQAVLKLFLHLVGRKKRERKKNSSLIDLSASPQVKMLVDFLQEHCVLLI